MVTILSDQPPIEPTFVAFLPHGPIQELWTYLYVMSKELQEFGSRVPIPTSGVPDGLECTREEFLETLRLFHRAGILTPVGPSGNDMIAFKMLIRQESIHIEEVDKVNEYRTPKEWIDVANRCREKIPHTQLAAKAARATIREWIEKNYPDIKGRTGATKVMGYSPDNQRLDYKWGYFYRPKGGSFYLKCLKGLEPVQLVPTETPMIRYNKSSSSALADPTPSTTTSVAQTDESAASTLVRVDAQIARLTQARELLINLDTAETESTRLREALNEMETQVALLRSKLKDIGM